MYRTPSNNVHNMARRGEFLFTKKKNVKFCKHIFYLCALRTHKRYCVLLRVHLARLVLYLLSLPIHSIWIFFATLSSSGSTVTQVSATRGFRRFQCMVDRCVEWRTIVIVAAGGNEVKESARGSLSAVVGGRCSSGTCLGCRCRTELDSESRGRFTRWEGITWQSSTLEVSSRGIIEEKAFESNWLDELLAYRPPKRVPRSFVRERKSCGKDQTGRTNRAYDCFFFPSWNVRASMCWQYCGGSMDCSC